jgi:hypothetical protein
MQGLLLKILIVAYASVGVVATIGYIPTIKDLWLRRKMSANISSYVIWTASSGTAFLYSLFILKDLLFRIVSGLNFVCCVLILMLIIFLKNHK